LYPHSGNGVVRSKLFGSAFRRRIGFRIRLADDNAPFQQDSLSERKQVAPARIVPFETSDRVVAQFQSLFPIGVTHRLGPPLFRGGSQLPLMTVLLTMVMLALE